MTDPDGDGIYETLGTLPTIPTGAGPIPLMINWKDRDDVAKKNYNGSFYAHRIYSANDDPAFSGPVKYLKVIDPSSGLAKNSVHFNDSIDFNVKVAIQASVGTQSQVTDPIVKLRVIGGSRNQSLDCDPPPSYKVDAQDPAYTNLWQELAYGCYPQYTRNTGTSCPNSNTALWSQTQPPAWQCIAVQTGSAKNQVAEGLNTRILGSDKPNACPPAGQPGHNNWSYDPDGDGKPNFPSGDPRFLFVYVTPFGTFTGSGNGTVPVTDFAEFYVTGWSGQGGGFNNPCQGNGDDPVPGPGTIVGHFVKYVEDLPGSGTGSSCVTDPSVLTPCIAIITQ
jgi:hypothetical protein